MKPSRSHIGVACLVGLVCSSLGAHIPQSKFTDVVVDVDDALQASPPGNDQPQYTLFLDEDALGLEQEYHVIQKRGYYTCYNRQVKELPSLFSFHSIFIITIGQTSRPLTICHQI
jgi:hypothetical protein